MVGNLAAIKDYATDYIFDKKEYINLDTMADRLLIEATKEYAKENYFDMDDISEIFNAISDEQFANIIKDYMRNNFFDKATIQLIMQRRQGANV